MAECGCGHDETAHRHYRSGTECSLCDCKRFHAAGGLRGLIRRLVNR